MKFAPVFLLKNGSMATSIHSNGQELSDLVFGSIQAEWTGPTASGSLKLQISNDNVPVYAGVDGDPAANVVNWSDYTGSTTPVAGDGNFTWNLFPMGYKWIRVAYTASSGTGSLTVELMGKG